MLGVTEVVLDRTGVGILFTSLSVALLTLHFSTSSSSMVGNCTRLKFSVLRGEKRDDEFSCW